MDKKALLACAVAMLAALPAVSYADVAFNVEAISDYRYRGISQTRLKPALQGGGGAEIELDLYGGVKGELAKNLAYDIGVLAYQYPGHDVAVSPNTFENYGAVTYGPVMAKYSHSTTNLFGFSDSKGSGYFDLAATFEISDGWMLTPHIGRQTVQNNGSFSDTDASLTLSKDFKGLVASLAAVDARTGADFGPGGQDLGKRSLVPGAKVNF